MAASSICSNEDFSADGAKHHKPSREAYAYVEKEFGAEPSRLCLIACHTWDTLGAVAAGWGASLIKRAGNDVLGVGPQPVVGNDLNDVANQLIARHKGRTLMIQSAHARRFEVDVDVIVVSCRHYHRIRGRRRVPARCLSERKPYATR